MATSAEADAVGLTGTTSGLKVTGVLPGLPSDAARLKPGDLILRIGESEFHRDDTLAVLMAGYRNVLEGKLGNKFSVTVLRNGKQEELKIELQPK